MASPNYRRRDEKSTPLEPSSMADSRSIVSQVMLPDDANPIGNVHGGAIMKMVDEAAAVAAMRHCHRQVVTVALDHMSFLAPAYIGDLVTVTAQVEYVGRTSMLVRADVETENPPTGRKAHTGSCVLTFVALDDEGHPVPVPPLLAETPDERARLAEGKRLYERLKEERARQSSQRV